jgi:hypothetical protein
MKKALRSLAIRLIEAVEALSAVESDTRKMHLTNHLEVMKLLRTNHANVLQAWSDRDLLEHYRGSEAVHDHDLVIWSEAKVRHYNEVVSLFVQLPGLTGQGFANPLTCAQTNLPMFPDQRGELRVAILDLHVSGPPAAVAAFLSSALFRVHRDAELLFERPLRRVDTRIYFHQKISLEDVFHLWAAHSAGVGDRGPDPEVIVRAVAYCRQPEVDPADVPPAAVPR